jgi:glycosyltransferase involved in cell wall biosynthesis
LFGGAGGATIKIHESLLNLGIDSKLLVFRNTSSFQSKEIHKIQKKSIYSDFKNTFRRYSNYAISQLFNPTQMFSSELIPFSNLSKRINEIEPDIVNLHWISGGMTSVLELGRITQPVVWTLCDEWAYTGGCHYTSGCSKFKETCYKCPQLKRSTPDLAQFNMSRKNRTFSSMNIKAVVGKSNWISNQAKMSNLFSELPVVTIPNPVDKTFQYISQDKSDITLDKYGIPHSKKIILFVATNALNDDRKGWKIINESLYNDSQKDSHRSEDLVVVVVGSSNGPRKTRGGIPIVYLGEILNKEELNRIYSISAILAFPSIFENLSNVLQESLASGLPAVCFDVGGNKDLVIDRFNGIISKPGSTNFWKALETAIYDSSFNREEISLNTLSRFDQNLIATQYVNVYDSLK